MPTLRVSSKLDQSIFRVFDKGRAVLDNYSGENSSPALTINQNAGGPGLLIQSPNGIKIVDGTQGSGKVLTSDANGLASWATAPSGNAYTDAAVAAEATARVAGDASTLASAIGYTDTQVTAEATARSTADALASKLGVANTFTTGNQLVNTGTAATKGVIVRGAASQTANLMEWQNSASSVLASVDATGVLTATGVVTSGTVSASALTGSGAGVTSLSAANVSSGTLADARLSSAVTMAGNTFNGVSQLVQLTSLGKLPALDGSALTNISGGGWSVTGNSGTVDGTNFIGTTDNIPFNIRVNNSRSGYINNTNPVTFFGYQAGLNNSGATYNSAFGYQALLLNTTGSYNTASGYYALYSNTTGNSNTASGLNALLSNTNGSYNTANGFAALYLNVAGSNATAIGTGAMYYANSTSTPFTNSNVAVGFEALRGSANPANNTGNNNTALGYQTLWSNTSGGFNTANGVGALFSNTGGTENTANGFAALYLNSTGSKNTANGQNALYFNTIGGNNTANGYQALFSNIGDNNTANGYQALYSNTGNNNTASGYIAGNAITTGSNNTAIGFNAQVPVATNSNQVRIGNTLITYAGVQVAWTITSDKRWKTDIQESNLGLNFISKLKPVSYIRTNNESKKREYGFIAQDLEEALNTSGAADNGIISKDDKGMYSVRYNDLIAPMVKAVQELNKQNKELTDRVAALEAMVKSLAEQRQDREKKSLGELR